MACYGLRSRAGRQTVIRDQAPVHQQVPDQPGNERRHLGQRPRIANVVLPGKHRSTSIPANSVALCRTSFTAVDGDATSGTKSGALPSSPTLNEAVRRW